jgi:predicted NBD/HSP70 family sugar kinase
MLPIRVGSKQLIREINQALVLNAIRMHSALSRTDVAHQTGLSLPTISDITAELIEAGLLIERSIGISTGGRKPVLLALNAQAGYAIGAKLTEDHIIVVLTDLDATVVARQSAPISSHEPVRIADALTLVVQALVPAAHGRPVFGVGIGMAGVIDRDRNLVRHATYFGWHNLAFAQMVEERVGLPVIVDNDLNALTIAEHWFGSGRGVADFVVISLGRGVGMGMVLDGRLYRGSRGGAGEFGHTTVVPDGPLCVCGKRGCLEALISDPAIAQRAAAALGRTMSVQEAVHAALGGDAALQSIFASAGRTLGLAVANLVNVLNPALVIISGEGVRAGELITVPFQRALREHCFDGLADELQIVTEPWGDEAWARGAASLLLSELFQPALRQGEVERPSLTVRGSS